MKARQIVPNVHWVGAVDWDRRLFDALIPLPDGTSYNAYFVQGSEKTALIDTVDPRSGRRAVVAARRAVRRSTTWSSTTPSRTTPASTPLSSSATPRSRSSATSAPRACSSTTCISTTQRFQVVADGDTVSLGGKTLQFVFTPWVHWPETMLTWLAEDQILFTCDFFGSHLATSDLFADRARGLRRRPSATTPRS